VGCINYVQHRAGIADKGKCVEKRYNVNTFFSAFQIKHRLPNLSLKIQNDAWKFALTPVCETCDICTTYSLELCKFTRMRFHCANRLGVLRICAVAHLECYIDHNHNQARGRQQKFFNGGQRQHFANLSQVDDDAIKIYVGETLYPYYTTTPQRNCPMLQQRAHKMHFVGSHGQVYDDKFYNRLSAYFQSRIFTFTDVLPCVLNEHTNYFILPSSCVATFNIRFLRYSSK